MYHFRHQRAQEEEPEDHQGSLEADFFRDVDLHLDRGHPDDDDGARVPCLDVAGAARGAGRVRLERDLLLAGLD